MPNKTTQILKEKIPSIETMLNCLRFEVDESIVQDVSKTIYEALSQQQQEDYQWEKRFVELKKYLLFQERMVETHHAGRTEGDELILLETINEHVEETEESEY